MYAYFYCCNVVCFFVIRLFRMAWKKGFSILRPLKSKQGFYITLEWRRAWLLKTLSVKQNHTGQVYFGLKNHQKRVTENAFQKTHWLFAWQQKQFCLKWLLTFYGIVAAKRINTYTKAKVGNLDLIGIGDTSPFINKGVKENPNLLRSVYIEVHKNYY